MLSAVSHGNRKHPINVTVDLLLLVADLTQLDSDWRDAEAHGLWCPSECLTDTRQLGLSDSRARAPYRLYGLKEQFASFEVTP